MEDLNYSVLLCELKLVTCPCNELPGLSPSRWTSSPDPPCPPSSTPAPTPSLPSPSTPAGSSSFASASQMCWASSSSLCSSSFQRLAAASLAGNTCTHERFLPKTPPCDSVECTRTWIFSAAESAGEFAGSWEKRPYRPLSLIPRLAIFFFPHNRHLYPDVCICLCKLFVVFL